MWRNSTFAVLPLFSKEIRSIFSCSVFACASATSLHPQHQLKLQVTASFDPNWLRGNKPKDTSSCSSVKTGSCPEKREPPERKAVLCIQPFFDMWQREGWGAQLWQRLAWSKPLSRHLRIQAGDTHWSIGNQALLVTPVRSPRCF